MMPPTSWDDLKPYEQRQGGFWLYGPHVGLHGEGKEFVRVTRPAPAVSADAVEAAAKVMQAKDVREGFGDYPLWEYTEDVTAVLEGAAPHMLVHVHHHDIEHHARSFNEGYEAAVTQGLADDPTLADDWFQGKLREARAEAIRDAMDAMEEDDGVLRPLTWLQAHAAAVEAGG